MKIYTVILSIYFYLQCLGDNSVVILIPIPATIPVNIQYVKSDIGIIYIPKSPTKSKSKSVDPIKNKDLNSRLTGIYGAILLDILNFLFIGIKIIVVKAKANTIGIKLFKDFIISIPPLVNQFVIKFYKLISSEINSNIFSTILIELRDAISQLFSKTSMPLSFSVSVIDLTARNGSLFT